MVIIIAGVSNSCLPGISAFLQFTLILFSLTFHLNLPMLYCISVTIIMNGVNINIIWRKHVYDMKQ